jgi:hypothetical protein
MDSPGKEGTATQLGRKWGCKQTGKKTASDSWKAGRGKKGKKKS